MPILRSTVSRGHAQADGRVYVRERHEWDDGEITELEYGPVSAALDHQAVATSRAAQIMEQRAAAEFEEVIGGA